MPLRGGHLLLELIVNLLAGFPPRNGIEVVDLDDPGKVVANKPDVPRGTEGARTAVVDEALILDCLRIISQIDRVESRWHAAWVILRRTSCDVDDEDIFSEGVL